MTWYGIFALACMAGLWIFTFCFLAKELYHYRQKRRRERADLLAYRDRMTNELWSAFAKERADLHTSSLEARREMIRASFAAAAQTSGHYPQDSEPCDMVKENKKPTFFR